MKDAQIRDVLDFLGSFYAVSEKNLHEKLTVNPVRIMDSLGVVDLLIFQGLKKGFGHPGFPECSMFDMLLRGILHTKTSRVNYFLDAHNFHESESGLPCFLDL